jgi:RNA polymerase sigma-70 factor (ECF subfamily)
MILQLWKSYPSFQGSSRFSTWMYRVALNTALMSVRKKDLLDFKDEREMTNLLPPWVEEEANHELKLLYKGISKLNRIDRALILLWLEDISYLEIGEILGISEKNVSVRLVRLRNKLSKIIHGFDYE